MRAFYHRIFARVNHQLTSAAVLLFISSAMVDAAVSISNVSVSSLPGTANPIGSGGSAANPYVDDVFFDSFDTSLGTFTRAGGNIKLGQVARVISGQTHVNAEYGDLDSGSDGNSNPFVKAGIIAEGDPLPLAIQESTDPSIQNTSITAAISTYSLTEGIDGEGPAYTMDYFFEVGVNDNDLSPDNLAEFVIFERGLNSGVILQAITGGSYDAPTLLGTAVTLDVSDFSATGIYSNTSEIPSAQQLGVAGVDLSEFGVGSADVFGLRITSLGDTGADLPGVFMTGETTSFTENIIVPEPSTMLMLALSFISALGIRRRSPV